MEAEKKYACPCCNSEHQIDIEGAYDICCVCGWEDAGYQRENIDETGPNGKLTLNEAKWRWAAGETLYARYPNPKSTKL